MKTNHLSPWEQEEYVIDRPTPQMLRHLNECAECRSAVEGSQHSTAIFRNAAVEWSAESLAARPRPLLPAAEATRPATALRWAIAAVLPLLLMVLVLLGLHPTQRPVHPDAAINAANDTANNAGNKDDALLEQVDEQLSVAVPASMESLTHLVSTESSTASERKGANRLCRLTRVRNAADARPAGDGLSSRACASRAGRPRKTGRVITGDRPPWKGGVLRWSARFAWGRTAAGGTIRSSRKNSG